MLKALLNSFHDELEIIVWYKAFLEEQPLVENIDQDDMLFQCMCKFPKRTILLNFLLDEGLSPTAKMDYSLCRGWDPEPCTALIQALLYNSKLSWWDFGGSQEIQNDVILFLLSHGDVGTINSHVVFPDN
jgi:hypothetical protein